MKTIISLITIVSVCFGVYLYIENRYAKAEDVKAVADRLDYKIVSDQVQYKQQRIWSIQDRYPEAIQMPPAVKEEYRQIQEDKKVLEKKLEVLEKK